MKTRKPYPDRETRIALADAQIEKLTKLNTSRKALIDKTEAKLNARKAAYAKSSRALEKAISRKARLEAAQAAPEVKKGIRTEKKIKAAQMDELSAVLESKGLTFNEFIENFKAQ